MFSCKYCNILKNTFMEKRLRTAASDGNFYAKKKFSFRTYQTWENEKKYLSQFLESCFPLAELTSNFLVFRIMAFTMPFAPRKNVSFPKDSLLPKFFYDEVVKEEKLDHGSFGSTCKARFKGGTVAIKEFMRNKWNEMENKNLKQAKILKSLNHVNVVNFKYICHYVWMGIIYFPRLEKLVDWNDFLGFSIIFQLKRWSFSSQK